MPGEPTRVWSGAGAVSPVWDARAATLVWVADGDTGTAAHALCPRTGGVTTTALPGRAAAVRPRVGGGLVANCDEGVALVGRREAWLVWWERTGATAGAAAVDADGRLWSASTGWLAVVDPDGSARVALEVRAVTGLAWLPDEPRLLLVDDGVLATHTPGSGERAEIGGAAAALGRIGGVCLDGDGHAWVTTATGVARVSPCGAAAPIATIDGATGCAFGGPRLVDLYVTTTTGVEVIEDAGSGVPTAAFLG